MMHTRKITPGARPSASGIFFSPPLVPVSARNHRTCLMAAPQQEDAPCHAPILLYTENCGRHGNVSCTADICSVS